MILSLYELQNLIFWYFVVKFPRLFYKYLGQFVYKFLVLSLCLNKTWDRFLWDSFSEEFKYAKVVIFAKNKHFVIRRLRDRN